MGRRGRCCLCEGLDLVGEGVIRRLEAFYEDIDWLCEGL